MNPLAVIGGLVLGVVAGAFGAVVALLVGLALAGEGGDRSTGADVLFVLPFALFALVSLVGVLVPAVRRAAGGLLLGAAVGAIVVLVGSAGVLVASGVQRL